VPLDEVEPAVSPLDEVELLLEVESWVLVVELEELWSLERSRGELVSLELLREGREELRPWALGWVFAESLLLIWSSDLLLLIWSSDLLRSLFWPCAVALESADVWPFGPELVVMDLSELDDELSLFVFALSDLLSEVLLELGVELELVSWLCARTPGAASARARTDSAMNLIRCLHMGVCVYAKVGDAASRKQRTTPREEARETDKLALEGPKHEEPGPVVRDPALRAKTGV